MVAKPAGASKLAAARRAAQPASEPRLTRLDSGLSVVTETLPHARTVSVGVHVGAGARHERRAEHGLSHLLEHMAFKGTRRRSARAIAEEIEAAGGDLNAETGVETTAYHARLLGEDLPVALDILADILTEPSLDPAELEREKGVILQEIMGVEDDPEDLVMDMFLERAFPGQPLGRPILGTRKSVQGFDPGMVRAYLDREYRAPAMVVSAAGRVDHDALVEAAARLFAGLPRGGEPAPPAGERARYQGGEERRVRKLEQAQIAFGLPGVSLADEELYAAQAFAHIVGGSPSSRLFQEIREARGLAYEIEAFHWPFSDCGVFALAAGTDARDAAELIEVAVDCLAKAADAIEPAELDRTRAQMKVQLLSALESPARRADGMARQILGYGRLIGGDEIIAKIDALTVEEVEAAGRRMLAGAPTLTAVGPVKRLPALDRLARGLPSHPARTAA